MIIVSAGEEGADSNSLQEGVWTKQNRSKQNRPRSTRALLSRNSRYNKDDNFYSKIIILIHEQD